MGNGSDQKKGKIKFMNVQVSIEYLVAFAFALILAIIVIALVFFSSQSNGTPVPSSCYISANLNCEQLYVTSNSNAGQAILVFTNLGKGISLSYNSFVLSVGSSTYVGNCYPSNASYSSTVTCMASMPGYSAKTDTQLNPRFQIEYKDCVQNQCLSASNQTVYNSSGTGTSYVSPTVAIDFVSLFTNIGTGEVVVDDIPYPSGTKIALVSSDHYSIGVDPPSGYVFSYWFTSGDAEITAGTVKNPSSTLTVSGNGTVTALFLTKNIVNLTFSEKVVQQGSSDIGTAKLENPADIAVICGGANAGGNVTPVCVGPDNYQVGTGSTYNTKSLSSGVYYFEACDLTYYELTGKALCSSVQEVIITPTISMTVSGSPAAYGTDERITATTSNSIDTVALCFGSDVQGATLQPDCTVSYSYELCSAVHKCRININGYANGTYSFIGCDLNYYQIVGGPVCSNPAVAEVVPTLNVTGSMTIPKIVLVYNSIRVPQGENDSVYGAAANSTVTDDIVLCVGSDVPNSAPQPACPAPDDYEVASGITNTTVINLGNYSIGIYSFVACDLTYYNDTGTRDCSDDVNLRVSNPNGPVIPPAPNVSISFPSGTVFYGENNVGTATTANSVDRVVICMNQSVYSSTVTPVCPSGDDYLVANGITNSTQFNTAVLPHGIYTFIACDASYYAAYGKRSCSATSVVTIIPPPPTIAFSFQSDPVSAGVSDNGTATSSYGFDTVLICVSSSTDGGRTLSQSVSCPSPDNYLVASGAPGTGSAYMNANTFVAGTYIFNACDSSYYLTYGFYACSQKTLIIN